jgi:hypothetical protein
LNIEQVFDMMEGSRAALPGTRCDIDRRETREDIDPVAAFDTERAAVVSAQRRLFDSIVRCERAEVWRRDGSRDLAQWLSARLGISSWAARRWVSAAHALERLPTISAAFETGSLSVDKVVELTRFATPATEGELVSWARRVSPAAVRRRADLAARRDIEDVREADTARYLRGWWHDDGARYGLEGCFPADQGVVIERALRRIAERVPEVPEGLVYGDGTPVPSEVRAERRCADALFVMASGGLASDPDPESATLVVHAELDALRGDGGGCEVEGGPVIHPEVAARLCCDSRLQVTLRDDHHKVVGVGWSSRNPPEWLQRALRHRDGGCTFPGCHLRHFVHAHHIVRWPTGPTNLPNLVLVCPFHHKLVHEHAWRVELDRHDAVKWFRPDGRPFDPTASGVCRAPPGAVARTG